MPAPYAFVCSWHIASFRCAAELGCYRGIADSGQVISPGITVHSISWFAFASAMLHGKLPGRCGLVRADDACHLITLSGNRQEIASMMEEA